MFTGSNTFNSIATYFSYRTIQQGAILIVSANSYLSGNGFNLSDYAINGYVYLQFSKTGLTPIQPVTQIHHVSTYDKWMRHITLSGVTTPNATLVVNSNNTGQMKIVTANAEGRWTATFENNHLANANTIFTVTNATTGVSVYTSLPVPEFAKSFLFSSMRYGTEYNNIALGMIGFNPFTMHLQFDRFTNPDEYPLYSNPTPLSAFSQPVSENGSDTLLNNWDCNLFSFTYGDYVINATGNMTIQEMKQKIDSLPIKFNAPMSYAVYLNDSQYSNTQFGGGKGQKWTYFAMCPGFSAVNNFTKLAMPPMSAHGENTAGMSITNFLYEFTLKRHGLVSKGAWTGNSTNNVPYNPTSPENKNLSPLQMVNKNNEVIRTTGERLTTTSYNLNTSNYESGLGEQTNDTYLPSYVVSTYFGSWTIMKDYQITTVPFNDWFKITSPKFSQVANSCVNGNKDYLTNASQEHNVLMNTFKWVENKIAYHESSAGTTTMQDTFNEGKGV